MASKFGGIPIDQPVSKFGGTPVLGEPISTLGMGGDPFKKTDGIKTPRQQAMAELAQETGFLEALGASVGKGFMTVGRGIGLAEPAGEIEQEAFSALAAEKPITSMVGETIGEAAPFLPLAVATGGISALAPRALATGAITAAEGGVLSAGRGADVLTGAGVGGAIGLGAEILIPVLGRLGGKVIRKLTGKQPTGSLISPNGQPTQELTQALESAGMTFDDLTEDAVSVIQQQGAKFDPEQLARKEFIESQGLQPTRAQVTRGAADFQAQQEAVKTSGKARTAIENQEAVLTTRFNDAVTQTTGDAFTPTNTVVDAVVDKATTLDREISSLYKLARESAPGEKNVRFNKLSNELRRLAPSNRRTGGNIEAIVGDLQSKGVLDKKMRVKGKIDVETAEDVRKLMNELYDPQNPFGNSILRTLKDSLDDDVFRAAGDDVFKQARKAKATFEQDLSRAKISKFDSRKQNLVRDLLENKIDPGQMTEKVVFGKSWRATDLKQLKDYIGTGQPFNDLRADVLEQIKTKSFIGPEDANGFKALSRDKLEKTINSIGWDKLNVLFDPKETKFLKDMLKVSKMREPVRGTAIGKGPSAQAVASLEQKLKNIPILGFLVDIVNIDAAGRAVLKGKPDKLMQQAGRIERAIPSTVAAAGVAGVLGANGRNQ